MRTVIAKYSECPFLSLGLDVLIHLQKQYILNIYTEEYIYIYIQKNIYTEAIYI
jgi:hypothetical protein